jgi:hypothetical protein
VPDSAGNNRNSNGTFKVGVSGNPKGRPKGLQQIPDILKKIGYEEGLKDGSKTKLEVVMSRVFGYALEGRPWAVQFIADRTEGKPKEFIEQKIIKDEVIVE